nr:IQ motif, EF-hand binding site [Tanacetum cinerariifolium]
SLLFKLDSVRGVENGVRDVRKSVAKKAVALQEKVDSIVQTYEEGDDDVSNDEDTEFDDVSNSIGNVVNEEDAKEEDVVDDDFSNDEKTALCDVSKENRDQELVVNEAMNGDSVKECDGDVSRNNVDSTDQTFEDYVDDDVVVDVDDVSNNAVNHEYVDNRDDVKEKKCDDDVSRSFVNEDRVIDYSNDDVNKRCCDKGMMEVMEKLMCDNAKM